MKKIALAFSVFVFSFGAEFAIATDGMSDDEIIALIDGSDDYDRYADGFVSVARQLIEDGVCTPEHLADLGGFWKSQSHKSKPIYFTYCGHNLEEFNATVEHRIYVNPLTEKYGKRVR